MVTADPAEQRRRLTAQVEHYLWLGHELRGFEVKGSGARGDNPLLVKVVRALLGLGNLRDGGLLVIGIDDKQMAAMQPGLNEAQARSWMEYDQLGVAGVGGGQPLPDGQGRGVRGAGRGQVAGGDGQVPEPFVGDGQAVAPGGPSIPEGPPSAAPQVPAALQGSQAHGRADPVHHRGGRRSRVVGDFDCRVRYGGSVAVWQRGAAPAPRT